MPTAEHYFLQPVSRTFHARDVFAPLAAYLAKGVAPSNSGKKSWILCDSMYPSPKALDEQYIARDSDQSGSLWQSDHQLHAGASPAVSSAADRRSKLRSGNREITAMQNAYGEAAPGEVFGILGSRGYLEIAANQASASQILTIGRGTQVDVMFESALAVPLIRLINFELSLSFKSSAISLP